MQKIDHSFMSTRPVGLASSGVDVGLHNSASAILRLVPRDTWLGELPRPMHRTLAPFSRWNSFLRGVRTLNCSRLRRTASKDRLAIKRR
jgi:hypothetical protein